jgi:uncharacterized protein (TIGR03437 family)
VPYSGPHQINSILPDESALGDASLVVRRPGWPDAVAAFPIAQIAPGVFTLNTLGLAAASIVRSRPGQAQSWESVYQVDPGGNVTAKPISFGAEDETLSLVLYCTGVRGRGAVSGVTLQIGDLKLFALYAGPKNQYAGLDQINVDLPRGLSGAGDAIVKATVDGRASNPVHLMFK